MQPNYQAILRGYYAAWSRQDVDAVVAHFAEGATFEDLALAATFEGLEAIRGFVELTYAGAPDFEVHPTEIITGDPTAAAAWTMTGTHQGDLPGLPATGNRFEVRATSIVTFEGEKIVRIVDYWNPLEFRKSVSAL